VASAQLNAIASLATLFVTPWLRAQFVSHPPASPWLSAGLGYGLYEGSSVLQNGVANTEISSERGDSAIRQGTHVRTQLKLLLPIGLRGKFRDFYASGNPTLGVPVRRSEQRNLVVSGRLFVHF